MLKHLKTILIILAQAGMFYLFPLAAGPLGPMGMIFVILLSVLVLSLLTGALSARGIKWLYPVLTAVMFIPSVFIYYNESALIHSVWYLVVSFIGLAAGALLRRLLRLKPRKDTAES